MNKRKIQNNAVIISSILAAFTALKTQTNWLEEKEPLTTKRERCYGVAKIGSNDCGTHSHTCAGHAEIDYDPEEWIMVPTGLCERLAKGIIRK